MVKDTRLSVIGGKVPQVLATQEAEANDETGAAIRLEQLRYERTVLDFEAEIRRRRDAMHAEHLANMRAALIEEAAE